ncbi:MAG: hypothetical protein F6J90_25545 [Moorea sp. SIOASIH]|nr:hypothetical protein [Moorena sp. SIOASIH]
MPLPCSLLPTPCSLKPRSLYFTELQTAVSKNHDINQPNPGKSINYQLF